jgi:phospholipase/carboxylesterase
VWFSELQDGNDELNRQSRDMLVAYIDNVIAEMQSQYLIDQIYLVGFSQGAAVSYISGISRPGIIDGIVVLGGGLDPAWFTNDELSAASGLRVFIAHGSEDNIENAQQARDLLTEAGFEVDFNEFPGGHFIHLDTLHEAFGWISE